MSTEKANGFKFAKLKRNYKLNALMFRGLWKLLELTGLLQVYANICHIYVYLYK